MEKRCAEVLSRLWKRGRAGRVHIPCPPRFLLTIKIAGIVGHQMHVFAIPGHFYGEYPDGGTLGYELSLRGPHPKPRKNPGTSFLYIPPNLPPCNVPRLSDRTDDEVCLRPEPC